MAKDVLTKSKLVDRIVDVATEAFVSKGIAAVKMDDIAVSLSISKRTLYEQFSNKEALLLECIKRGQKEDAAYLERVASEADNVLETIMLFYENAVGKLRQTSPRFLRDLHKYPLVYDYLEKCRFDNLENSINFFKKGIEQGLFRDDVDFELFHMMSHEQMNLMCDKSLWGRFSLVQIFNSIILVNMRGISTHEGLKKIDEYVDKLRIKENIIKNI